MSDYETLKQKILMNKDIEIEDVNREEITDIKNIKINDKLPKEERIIDFLKKVNNPYIIKVNDVFVKNTFSNRNIVFSDCFKNVLKNNI